ncbi:hypothetical protein CYMTET_17956 [Cymbomonas tetramitiformis]|uniref:Uncharacterized protein n=1 Tax=Cymbomonas tetramitiformis TaxID=36881 RepID=A0AAE0G9H6_9CHLO|nr:hypothetical protein CYMTET_17956 [Cymbomonas tetramitiformis]
MRRLRCLLHLCHIQLQATHSTPAPPGGDRGLQALKLLDGAGSQSWGSSVNMELAMQMQQSMPQDSAEGNDGPKARRFVQVDAPESQLWAPAMQATVLQ